MNLIPIYLTFFSLFGCTTPEDEPKVTYEVITHKQVHYIENEQPMAMHPDHPYKFIVWAEKNEEGQNQLLIDMKLFNGSHYVSPNAKRDFKGKFNLNLDASAQMSITSDLHEIPASKEEFDPHPFVNGLVNWVREDTRYILDIEPTTSEDFEVRGVVKFVIEPKCTMEEIPIVIKQEDGTIWADVFGC